MDIRYLGRVDYAQAWQHQRECVQQVILNRQRESLLLCEHPAVLTLGRMADRSHILWSQDNLDARGIPVFDIDRGGEVTLHAPGQLVAYPILDLQRRGKNLHDYLYKLEQLGIDFLKHFDIMGKRIPGKTGVWIGSQKIMSAGIGVRRWVSCHGISLNIHTDLSLFKMIHPCGMDIPMTSVKQETGHHMDLEAAAQYLVTIFQKLFGVSYA